jgi:hypothetical protein
VHIDTDVDRHCRVSFPARNTPPGASRYRAERERGPALIGSEEEVKRWRLPGSVATATVPGSSSVLTMGLRDLPWQRSRLASGRVAAADQGGEYSREVPQQTRICTDLDARAGTATCGDGRGWTCCLLFASRGSGVRVPLAPQIRAEIRTARFESTAAKYRNRGRLRCPTRVRAGPCPRGRRRTDPRSCGRDPGH